MRSSVLRMSFIAFAALAPSLACGGKSTAGTFPVTTKGTPSANLQAVIASIQGQMASCGIPGATIAVVENGKLTDSAGIGVEDPRTEKPVAASTLFPVGGSAEPLVDLAALALAREGKLDFTAPLTRYVPLTLAAGFDPAAISVDQVLLSTSGLPELNGGGNCGPDQENAWFAANAQLPLWSPPGAVWNFSHLGYGILGWVIENASAQTFADVVQSRVLLPAGMVTATYDATVASAADHAVGQTVDPQSGQLTAEASTYGDSCALFEPADGLFASVLDYASLAETLLAGGGAMLDAASVAKFETPQVPDYISANNFYTYGMRDTESFAGVGALRAGGSPGGFSTEFWLVPERRFAVAVFFSGYNATASCDAYAAASFATQTYLGLGGDGVGSSDAAADWTPWVGTYVDPIVLGTVEVTLSGNQLTATTTAFGPLALTPSSGTAFHATIESSDYVVNFQPDESGPGGWFVTPYGVAKRRR